MAARRWIATKDLGRTDEDGYFFHGGRADDVIISAGWTMSAIEIEDAVLKHPDVREVGAIGVPDKLRGLAVIFDVMPAPLGYGPNPYAMGDSRWMWHYLPDKLISVSAKDGSDVVTVADR